MKLSAWYKECGHEVFFTRKIHREKQEPNPTLVYGSTIFQFSSAHTEKFREEWPKAIIGGTGSSNKIQVEEIIGHEYENYDYSLYPDFPFSIGFTQRGCRLRCKFCVVPEKEGKPRSVNTIADIWRGPGHPKKLLLLDNDFFGESNWKKRIEEIRDGGFKVSLNQGINIRLIDEEAAQALASIQYRDGQFRRRRLYTAWDNLGDEKIFFRGVKRLEAAGIPPKHLMVYMLIGYDPNETMELILYRFNKMVERGILPYPMVYNNKRKDLKEFQRWAVRGLYRIFPFSEYDSRIKRLSKKGDSK